MNTVKIFNIEIGDCKRVEVSEHIRAIHRCLKASLTENERYVLVPTRNGIGQISLAEDKGEVVIIKAGYEEILKFTVDELREFIESKTSQKDSSS